MGTRWGDHGVPGEESRGTAHAVKQDIRLGTFFGIEVGLNWSVVVILALFAWELADAVLPARPGHASTADWIAGVAGGVVLLASVLAHEVSHALVAKRNDVRVRSITLFVFGGVAQLEGEAHTPGADFRIAAVGPATSVALAVLFAALEALLRAAGWHGLAVAVLSWLWQINLLLAIFNLIPGAPLDGGRILRAALWHRDGDRLRASIAAARAGRGVAIVLIALGLVAFVATGSVLGLWPALIGLFVYSAARAEERFELVLQAVSALDVGQVMTAHPPTLPLHSSVADVTACVWRFRCEAVLLIGGDGRPAGLVTAGAVDAVPVEARAGRGAIEIALPLDRLLHARADEPLPGLIERMASSGAALALVVDVSDQVTGIVTASDIDRAVALGAGRQIP